jgi:phage terminase large subunit GpA-like protein
MEKELTEEEFLFKELASYVAVLLLTPDTEVWVCIDDPEKRTPFRAQVSRKHKETPALFSELVHRFNNKHRVSFSNNSQLVFGSRNYNAVRGHDIDVLILVQADDFPGDVFFKIRKYAQVFSKTKIINIRY